MTAEPLAVPRVSAVEPALSVARPELRHLPPIPWPAGVWERVVPPRDADEAMVEALELVDRALPGMSARRRLSMGQRLGMCAGAGALGAALAISFTATVTVLVAVASLTYLLTLGFRVLAFRASLRADVTIHVSDTEARSIADHELPTYTVLVPAFAEPGVIADLVRALERLDYPDDLLDIKLLLEESDQETLQAARSVETSLRIEILIVPAGVPQTKPRALNYGLLWSSADLVTVFDAEDRPEPLQLRRSAVAFSRVAPDVACLQARLEFYDADRNLLTKWFSIEYLTWFRCFLPGLVAMGAPPPLGGTSNHFRREALLAAGGWDPFNVTEDIDLGLRLNRIGYHVEALDSVTFEEANSDVVNWVKQRSRWQKGYLQTALVHLRNPRHGRRQLGWRGLIHLVLFVGGTPILAVTNLAFWALTVLWLLTKAEFIQSIFPPPVYYLSVASWIVGNLTILCLGIVTLLVSDRPKLLAPALLAPLYWILMSVAGLRAVVQLVTDPFHWEKTTHGLAGPGRVTDSEPEASVEVGPSEPERLLASRPGHR